VPTTMVVMAFIYTYTNWYHVKKICSRGRESDLESAGNRPGLTLENP
jgi:hypothetical protein